LTGFAHGAAGIAWALLRLSVASGEQRFRKTALEALAFERSMYAPGVKTWPDLCPDIDDAVEVDGRTRGIVAWCHGAPGIGLARLSSLSQIDSTETRAEIEAALQTTFARGLGGNHTLCHGGMGNLEVLMRAGEELPDEVWARQGHRAAAEILHDIRRGGWRCATPSGVETPGLMVGIAGIGYGLLRLADPDRVPSVLVLEPPRHVLSDRPKS
jgi:lantibiotic modifying enzyme